MLMLTSFLTSSNFSALDARYQLEAVKQRSFSAVKKDQILSEEYYAPGAPHWPSTYGKNITYSGMNDISISVDIYQ